MPLNLSSQKIPGLNVKIMPHWKTLIPDALSSVKFTT